MLAYSARMLRLVQAVLWAATTVLPASALAQEDGVFVDPDSPAGKEYAIPLDEARREATGGEDGTPGSAPPLFGEGVMPESAPREHDASDRRDRNRSSSGRNSSGDRTAATPTGPSRSEAAPGLPAAGGGSASATVVTGGLALAVLAAGSLIGLALRRASRRSQS